MLKNLMTNVHAVLPNLGDSFVLALADLDASDAEISTAMQATSQSIEDSVEYIDGQQEVRRVWDIQGLNYNGLVAAGSVQQMIQWKLPPKGIPLLKGRGLKLVVYNTDTAASFSNGPIFKHHSKAMGGWF